MKGLFSYFTKSRRRREVRSMIEYKKAQLCNLLSDPEKVRTCMEMCEDIRALEKWMEKNK